MPFAYIMCFTHAKNYGAGKTTNERYARQNRTASAVSEDDFNSDFEEEEGGDGEEKLLKKAKGNRRRRGCWGNCGQMCCNKRIQSQADLLAMHMAESAMDSQTSIAED